MWVVLEYGGFRQVQQVSGAALQEGASVVELSYGGDEWDFPYASEERASIVHSEFLAAVLRGERVFYMPGE